jgi:hypothetical protein
MKSSFSEGEVKGIPHTHMSSVTEIPGQMGCTPESYSGVPGFIPESCDRLHCLIVSWLPATSPSKMQDCAPNQAKTDSFQILSRSASTTIILTPRRWIRLRKLPVAQRLKTVLLFMETKCSSSYQQQPSSVPFLGQINPAPNFLLYSSNITCNIFLSRISSKLHHLLKFLTKTL